MIWIYICIGILKGLSDSMLYYQDNLNPKNTYKRKSWVIMNVLTFLRDPWHNAQWWLFGIVSLIPLMQQKVSIYDPIIFFLSLSITNDIIMRLMKNLRDSGKHFSPMDAVIMLLPCVVGIIATIITGTDEYAGGGAIWGVSYGLYKQMT